MKWALSILFLCLCSFQYKGDFYEAKWALFMSVSAIYFSCHVTKRLHWSVFPVTVYTLLSTVWTGMWGYNQFATLLSPPTLAYISLQSVLACVYFASFVGFAAFTHIKTLRKLPFVIGVFSVVSSVYFLVDKVMGYGKPDSLQAGFLENITMNNSMVMITAPFIFFVTNHPKKWLLFLLPLATLLCSSITGDKGVWLVALVVLSSWLYFTEMKRYLLLLPTLMASILGCLWLMGTNIFGIFSSGDRIVKHLGFLRYYWDNDWIYFGSGQGSFSTLSSIKTFTDNPQAKSAELWLWAHSDFLQVLLEQGLVGFSLVCLFLYHLFSKIIKKQDAILLSSLLGYCALAVVYFPVHWPVEAFIGVTLVSLSFRLKEKVYVESV